MMTLYSGSTDPYSHRCRIVLFEIKTPALMVFSLNMRLSSRPVQSGKWSESRAIIPSTVNAINKITFMLQLLRLRLAKK